MGSDKYLFARMSIYCSSHNNPSKSLSEHTIWTSYYQCMCDGGIPSYCSRVGGSTEVSWTAPTTESPWTFSNPLEDVDIFLGSEREASVPDLNTDARNRWAKTTSHLELDSIIAWIGIMTIISCVFYVVSRCTRRGGCCGPTATASREGARTETSTNSARPAGGAGAGAVANGSGGGGGGGGGAASGATPSTPPADLPPSYELVCEENVLPPTYEEVMREEAKISPGDAV